MKVLLSFALFISTLIQIQAQGLKSNTIDELKLKKCEFEPDAPAVVLFDKGEVKFVESVNGNGFVIHFTRHKRIKIFKEAAFDQAEIEIPLYKTESNLEILKEVNATTYYYNGSSIEITKLDKSQIYEEPINQFWYEKKFTMPNIKEGCFIDITYTIESPFITYLPDWEFQSNIPTYYSEFKTNMIPFYSYTYVAQGENNFDVFKKEKNRNERSFMNIKFNDMSYTFGLKNIHSFTDESFISSREDYIKKIDFQLSEINYPSGYSKKYMSTWPELSKELLQEDYFGKYIKKAEKIGKKDFVNLQNLTDEEKIKAVIQYMKTNYKHNGKISKWAIKSIKSFTTEKTGNSANINLMAIGILQGLGVDVKPVIISTRDHGKVTKSFPLASLFNDVLILYYEDNKPKIFDATDTFYPDDQIPEYCYNGKGYVVDGNENWIYINDMHASNEYITLSYSIDPENFQIHGKTLIKTTGQVGIDNNKEYNTKEEEFTNNLEKNGLKINDQIKVTDNDKGDFNCQFAFESEFAAIDNQLIIRPFLQFPIQDNPFKQKERDYDIDFIYPRNNTYVAMITIPEGYKVENKLNQITKETQNVAFNFKYVLNENTIILSASYRIKKSQYPPSSYNELKGFFNTLTKSLNERIVFIKTTVNETPKEITKL